MEPQMDTDKHRIKTLPQLRRVPSEEGEVKLRTPRKLQIGMIKWNEKIDFRGGAQVGAAFAEAHNAGRLAGHSFKVEIGGAGGCDAKFGWLRITRTSRCRSKPGLGKAGGSQLPEQISGLESDE